MVRDIRRVYYVLARGRWPDWLGQTEGQEEAEIYVVEEMVGGYANVYWAKIRLELRGLGQVWVEPIDGDVPVTGLIDLVELLKRGIKFEFVPFVPPTGRVVLPRSVAHMVASMLAWLISHDGEIDPGLWNKLFRFCVDFIRAGERKPVPPPVQAP